MGVQPPPTSVAFHDSAILMNCLQKLADPKKTQKKDGEGVEDTFPCFKKTSSIGTTG